MNNNFWLKKLIFSLVMAVTFLALASGLIFIFSGCKPKGITIESDKKQTVGTTQIDLICVAGRQYVLATGFKGDVSITPVASGNYLSCGEVKKAE